MLFFYRVFAFFGWFYTEFSAVFFAGIRACANMRLARFTLLGNAE
jgi:hypothetical protein